MPEFSIIEARLWHCGQMARLLRHEHQRALAPLGVVSTRDSHRELRARFEASSFRRAWLIDGELAGLGGVAAPLMAATGFLWLVLSERARQYPVAIVKEARRQLAEIMVMKRELATTILGEDAAALRLAVFLGFHVTDHGEGAQAHSRPARHALMRHLANTPDVRLPMGSGFVIPMGYHAEAT